MGKRMRVLRESCRSNGGSGTAGWRLKWRG